MGSKKKPRKKDAISRPLRPEEEESLRELLARAATEGPDDLAAEAGNSIVAEALIGRLAKIEDPPLGLMVALREAYPEKNVRKALKKARFQLERRGIESDCLREPGDGPALSPGVQSPATEEVVALVGPVLDLNGTRAVIVTLNRRTRGHEILMAVVSPENGFADFFAGKLSKKHLRDIRKEIEEEGSLLAETTLGHIMGILETGYQQHLILHNEAPEGYLEMRSQLMEMAGSPDLPFSMDEMLSDGEEELAGTQLERLFEDPAMDGWLVDSGAMQPYAAEMGRAGESPLVLSAVTRTERLEDIKRRAAFEIFTGEKVSRVRENLIETAAVFAATGKEDLSRSAIKAARMLDRSGHQSDFIRYLLNRSMEWAGGIREAPDQGATASGGGEEKSLIFR